MVTEPTYRIEVAHDPTARLGQFDYRVFRLSDDRVVAQGYWQPSREAAYEAARESIKRLRGQENTTTIYAHEDGTEAPAPAVTPESRRA